MGVPSKKSTRKPILKVVPKGSKQVPSKAPKGPAPAGPS